MNASGYFNSPWPCEDAGPARMQSPHHVAGLNLQKNERLACTTRHTWMSTMTVLGDPGEVYLMHHSALRAKWGQATTACIELIDPISLKTQCKSPRLAGGPMWPGGMAVHRNGSLLAVYGRYAHKLNRQCKLLASKKLPVNQAYNSFVILDNGFLVTKNLSNVHAAHLSVLNPDTLEIACPEIVCPEPSVARLSAAGNSVYVVGVRSIFRYVWDQSLNTLVQDLDWKFEYLKGSPNSYGWDVVLDGRDAWFMDNGAHRYQINMVHAGVKPTANRLIRVSLTNSQDHQAWPICGLPGGSITNPPLIDIQRSIVMGYDSANRHLQAWRFERDNSNLKALWQKSDFGCASHMLLFSDTAELCVNDYRRFQEQVVVLNIETGEEKARVKSGGLMQGVVFPSVGWNRDFYWSSMGRLARIHVN